MPRRRPASHGSLSRTADGWDTQSTEVWTQPEMQSVGLAAKATSCEEGHQRLSNAEEGPLIGGGATHCGSSQMPIQVRVNVLDILEVNCELGHFTAIFEIAFAWIDARITAESLPLNSASDLRGKERFIPRLSVLNQASALEELGAPRVELLEITEAGASFEALTKYKCSFQDSMDASAFPFDRQLLRMKFAADAGLERFKLVPQSLAGGAATMLQDRGWKLCNRMQNHCTMYVHPPRTAAASSVCREPARIPFHVLLHVERKIDLFVNVFSGILLLSTLISTMAYLLPLDLARDRLWLLLINAMSLLICWYAHLLGGRFPHIGCSTRLDRYVLLTICFKAILLAESFIVALFVQNGADLSVVGRQDATFAIVVFALWVVMHMPLLFFSILFWCRRRYPMCTQWRHLENSLHLRAIHGPLWFTMCKPWWKLYQEKGETAWSDKPYDSYDCDAHTLRKYSGWEPGGKNCCGPVVRPLDKQHLVVETHAWSLAREDKVVARELPAVPMIVPIAIDDSNRHGLTKSLSDSGYSATARVAPLLAETKPSPVINQVRWACDQEDRPQAREAPAPENAFLANDVCEAPVLESVVLAKDVDSTMQSVPVRDIGANEIVLSTSSDKLSSTLIWGPAHCSNDHFEHQQSPRQTSEHSSEPITVLGGPPPCCSELDEMSTPLDVLIEVAPSRTQSHTSEKNPFDVPSPHLPGDANQEASEPQAQPQHQHGERPDGFFARQVRMDFAKRVMFERDSDAEDPDIVESGVALTQPSENSNGSLKYSSNSNNSALLLPTETFGQRECCHDEESRWICSKCGEINNARRFQCNLCGNKAPEVTACQQKGLTVKTPDSLGTILPANPFGPAGWSGSRASQGDVTDSTRGSQKKES